MREFVALSPRLGETLRPLCRMLDIPYAALGIFPRPRARPPLSEVAPEMAPEVAPEAGPAEENRKMRPAARAADAMARRARVGGADGDISPDEAGLPPDPVARSRPPRGSSFLKPA